MLRLVHNSPVVADPKLQFSADPKYSVREISGCLFVSGQHQSRLSWLEVIETKLILLLNNQKTEFQAVSGVYTSASYVFLKNVMPFLF